MAGSSCRVALILLCIMALATSVTAHPDSEGYGSFDYMGGIPDMTEVLMHNELGHFVRLPH